MRAFKSSVLAAMLGLVVAACSQNQALLTLESVPTKATVEVTLEQVSAAIIEAGAGRGWSMTEVEPGLIRGEILVRGKHKVAVNIPFTTTTFSILYLSSENMNYQLRDGEPRIHPKYNSWIKNLERDIQNRIKLL